MIKNYIKAARPKYLMPENVAGLAAIDKGRAFQDVYTTSKKPYRATVLPGHRPQN